MNTRGTLLLCVVAVSLGAFIYFYERHTLSTDEVAERQDRLLTRFVRERVVSVEIERSGVRMVVTRDRDEEEALGEWMMQEPLSSRTDADHVDAMLGALQWARPLQKLSGISEDDRDAFGLTTPRLEVRFTAADQVVPVRFGSEDPTEGGLYLQLDDPTVAYVVGVDLFEALDHEVDYFRSKELFPLTAIRRTHSLRGQSEESWRMEREEGLWRIRDPSTMLASSEGVTEVLGAVASLVATRFVDDEDAETSMQSPDFVLTGLIPGLLESPDQRFELALGGECGSHSEERLARADDGPLVCVSQEAAETIQRSAAELQEMRLMPLDPASLFRIKITGEDDSWVELRRSENEDGDVLWRYQENAGASVASGPADLSQVAGWLEQIASIEGGTTGPNDAPRRTVRLEFERRYLDSDSEEQSADFELSVGTTVAGWWAHRAGETYAFNPATLSADLLRPTHRHFLNRQLLDLSDEALQEVRVVRRSSDALREEVVARDDGGLWRIGESSFTQEQADPSVAGTDGMRADVMIMNGLTRRLMRLEAERFVVADGVDALLSQPSIEVRFQIRDDQGASREHRLLLREHEGEVIAKLDDAPAFFVAEELFHDLRDPFWSRESARVPRDDIASMQVQGPDGDWTIRRRQGVFVPDGIAPGRVEPALEAIGGLRFSRLRPRDIESADPIWRLQVERRQAGEANVVLSANSAEADAAGLIWVWDGAGRSFGITQSSFDAIFGRETSQAPVGLGPEAAQIQVNTPAGAQLDIQVERSALEAQ